jgi:hypothetical protein
MMLLDNLADSLRRLPPAQRDREIRHIITDSLQDLVAALEHDAVQNGVTWRSCVPDDFHIERVRWLAGECVVLLTYNVSAKQGLAGRSCDERIFGNAVVTIDKDGQVSFKSITSLEEQEFVAPDLGGGD